MAKKVNQEAIRLAIAKRNADSANKCPHCVKGKIGKATCGTCHGTGKR